VAGEAVGSFCSRRSIAAHERRFGTASSVVEVWLLLEYNGPWTRQLLADSYLAPDVKRKLRESLESVPRSRLLFIRNELRGQGGLSFFLAVTREQHQALYRFDLSGYRDLLSIDVSALANGDSGDEHIVNSPLYLVCADGKHDQCCAKFGLPVYRELARSAGDAVWHSSHVGGDRFAANIVCLPSGVYYGHVTPEEARWVVDYSAGGYVYLDKLRGRSCYPFEVQAAEYFARVASGLQRVQAFTLQEVSRGNGEVRVRLREAPGQRVHVVKLARDPSAFRAFLTCTSAREEDVAQYTLRDYRVE
jgi:hypothetical protein